MAFDIEGARAAGYSDGEIADFLGKDSGFDVAGAQKAGYEPAEIVAHLSSLKKPASPVAATDAEPSTKPRGEIDYGNAQGFGASEIVDMPLKAGGMGSVLESRAADRPEDPLTLDQLRALEKRPVPRAGEQTAAPVKGKTIPVNRDGTLGRAGSLVGAQLDSYSAGLGYKLGDAASAVGADAVAKDLRGRASNLEGRADQTNKSISLSADGAFEKYAPQILAVFPTMAVAAATGGLPVMFGISEVQSYAEGRKAGLSPAAALGRAVPMGAAEVIGEKLGGTGKLLEALEKAAIKGGSLESLKELSGRLAASGMREVPSEEATYAMQFGIDKAPGIGLKPNAGMADFLEGAKDTAIVAAGAGGMMAGGSMALNRLAAREKAYADKYPTDPGTLPGVPPAPVDPVAAIGKAQTVDEAIAVAQASLQSSTAVDNIGEILKQNQPSGLINSAPAATENVAGLSPDVAQTTQAITELEAANVSPPPASPLTEAAALDEVPAGAAAGNAAQPAGPGALLEAVPAEPGAGALTESPNVQNQTPAGPAAQGQAAPAQTPETGTAAGVPPAAAGTATGDAAVQAAGVDQRLVPLSKRVKLDADPAATAEAITGEQLDKQWTAFAPDSGTLAVPRAEMPQIKAEHRGAMVNFLNARDIAHTQEEVPATSLKPTQAEFSPSKVEKALGFTGPDRSILVSSDNHVLDGHHQWMSKLQAGEPVKIIRLDAPIKELLETVKEFPSAEQARGATATQQRADFAASEKTRKVPGTAARTRANAENPFKAFLGKHGISNSLAAEFAPGRKERQAAMVQGYGPMFRKSGPLLDALAARAVEEGFLLTPDEAKLQALITDTLRGKRIIPQYAQGVAEDEGMARAARAADLEQQDAEAQNAEVEAENQAERDAIQAVADLPDTALEFLSDADIVLTASNNVSEADFLRALGATEQEIEDATAKQSEGARQGDQGRAGAEETAASATPGDPQGRDSQAGGGEGLSNADARNLSPRGEAAQGTAAKTDGDGGRDAALRVQSAGPVVGEAVERGVSASGNGPERGPGLQGLDQGDAGTGADGAGSTTEGLTSPTPADVLAQQQRAADGDKADAKAATTAADRARADAERNEFTLTGSDRPADVAAAGGQQDIFADPVAETKATLDANNVTGKERLDVLKDVKTGALTVDEVKEAYPTKIEDVGEKIGGARKDTAVSTGARKKSASEDDSRATWAKRFQVAQVAGGFDASVNGRDITGKWTISDLRTRDRFDQPKRMGDYFDTQEAAEAALPLLALAQKHRAVSVNTADGQKYEIWRDINDRKRVKVVDREFDTREDAMRYMAQNATEILETNTTFGEADLPKPESTARKGVERRTGDVKGEDFRDTFGFRGVEFGLWNNQDERQEVMNAAYDGLLDLADVLKVPAKAIGLNGDLALAFGARGKGLSGARAHYETDRVVMNLTKMNGAGALAHEWFHALDHYLARQDGKTTADWKINSDGTRSLKVYGGDSDMASSGFRRANSGVREELRTAYTSLVQSLFTKAEQYVEDTARADKFVAVARGELEKDLNDLRKDLSEQKDVRYYKRNNKPASAEQLAEFDAMAAELVEGRGLSTEWKSMPGKTRMSIQTRHTNDTLEKLNDLYKSVRGRSGFNTERRGVLDALTGYMRRYDQRLQMLREATALTPKTKRVPTSFAMDAKSLDQGRGGDYWTSPHEMVARAFQGYVEDAIAAKEGRSPFLNYAPENAGILTPWGAKRPYPAGEERKTMNAEFDKFIDVLQTKETDKGVMMFSRAPAAPKQTDTPAFKKWFGDSKVVDAAGKPLRMYHGTAGDFGTFDSSRRGRSTLHATAQLGDFFTAAPRIANEFVPLVPDYDTPPYTRMRAKTGGNVMPVYLSIKNPYTGLHLDEFRSMVNRNNMQESKEMHADLVSQGYDGIYLRGDPSLEDTMAGDEWSADTWISFAPEQIKSAIGNNGDFDPDNADVRFSRAASGDERNALEAISQNDELFALPKSDKTTIEGIAADNAPGITVKKMNYPGLVTTYALTMPDGAKANIMVRKVNPYGEPQAYGMVNREDGEFEASTDRPGRSPENVPEDTEDVYIDVSNLKEGGQGRLVYNIAATFAHNTNRILIGDPAGLSNAAMRRRTEHMLSSALKFGTTRHLAPHPRQTLGAADIGVPPLRWTYGDDLGNIKSLIQVSTESLENAGGNPFTFDPTTGTFRDSEGGAIDDDGISLVVEAGSGRTGKAGDTTLKRGAVLSALLREQSQEGSGTGQGVGVLGRLVAWGREHSLATRGIFYSEGSTPAGIRNPSTVERVQAAVAELIGGKQLPNKLGRVIVATSADVKSHWLPLMGKNAQLGSEGEAGVAQAFYEPGTRSVVLIADNIPAGDETAVAAHELMHKHGQTVLGKDGWDKLHTTINSWANAPEDSDERAVYTYARSRVEAVGLELSSQEMFPYAVEAAIKMGVKPSLIAKQGTVARWLGSVKYAMQQAWGKVTGKPETFKTQDLVDLAFGVAQMENPESAAAMGRITDAPVKTDSPEFERWFGDSKVVDATGKPLRVFHGTNKSEDGEAITMFDTYGGNYGLFGLGAYFTENPEVASSYVKKGRGVTPTVYPAYMRLNNPIDMDAKADPAAWQKAVPETDFSGDYKPDGDTNEAFYRAVEEQLRDEDALTYEAAETMQEALRTMGHDGITHIGGGRVKSEGVKHRVFIAFDPEQIKSATGNTTFDPAKADIRFSRTATQTGTPAAATKPALNPWRDETGRLQFAPGAWLYDQIGKAASPMLVRLGMKAATPELRRQLRQMKIDVEKAQEVAVAIARETTKLSEEERAMVSDLVEQEMKVGVIPPAHAVKLAAMINDAMGRQTDELVSLGMLTKDSADKWRGKYLPRYYESKLKDKLAKTGATWADALMGLTGRQSVMKGIKGKNLKGRGLYETIPEAQLKDYEALGWEVRDPDYTPSLPTVDGTVQVWRDFSPAEREKMGEIRDAGFRFVMGYMQTQRDIALGRMFERMAQDPESSSRLEKEGYVQVPTTVVSGTGAKVYGKLAGRWVPTETMSQLSNIEESTSAAWQMYRKAMAVWKSGKTALNPVSHVNNIVSNLTMAHLAGVSYLRGDKYLAAARDFVKKTPMLQEAKDNGLFLGTLSDTELMNSMPEELRILAQKQESTTLKVARTGFDVMTMFLRKPMGAAYQAEDTFFRYLIYKDARERGTDPQDAVDYAQRYIFTYDDLPKGARRIRDFGIPFFSYTYKAAPALLHTALTHPLRMAAPAAVLWGINAAAYAIATGDDDDDWQDSLQKYITDPAFRAKAREQEKLEREHLPPWNKGTTSMLTPKMIRLGMDEVTKLPLFIDVSRIIPGGDLFDISPNAGGIPLPQPITPSHPLFTTAVAMLANRDLFRGKELTDSNDTTGEKAAKRAEWLWTQLAPAVAAGNYHFEKGMNALAQASGGEITWLPEGISERYTGIGRDGLPVQPKLAAAQTFGIKIRPIDLDTSAAIDGSLKQKMIRDIDTEIRALKRLSSKGAISEKTLDKARDLAKVKKDRIRDDKTVDGDDRP